jgi:DNA helicase-2/ATP-dependent DNA helicase PcrA
MPVSSKAAQSWDRLSDIFLHVAKLDAANRGFISEVLDHVISRKYSNYLKDNFENHRDRQDDLDEIVDFVYNYESLDKLLSDLMLDENFAGQNDRETPKDALILSTIHQAKGLEWGNVFIIGLRDGAFPHYKSLDSEIELEEERRLFYVAATRAQNELVLLYPSQSTNKGFYGGQMFSGPSIFIKELDRKRYSTLGKFGVRFERETDEGEDVIRYD